MPDVNLSTSNTVDVSNNKSLNKDDEIYISPEEIVSYLIGIENPNRDYITDLKSDLNNLMLLLEVDSKEFEVNKFIDSLKKYIGTVDRRILYSYVSNSIFGLQDEEQGNVISNIDKTLSYVYSERFKSDDDEKLKKYVLKLYDHINLAVYQKDLSCQNQDVITRIQEETQKSKNEIDQSIKNQSKKIDEKYNEIYGQLIGMVGIFTALSFLLFGGISSLDNIFNSLKDIPIIKIVLTGSVWSIMIFNTVFIFLYYISKMVNLPFYVKNEHLGFTQKYPSFIIVNVILVFVLLISAWIYYITYNKIFIVIDKLTHNHPVVFLVVTGLIFIVLIILCVKKVSKQISVGTYEESTTHNCILPKWIQKVCIFFKKI